MTARQDGPPRRGGVCRRRNGRCARGAVHACNGMAPGATASAAAAAGDDLAALKASFRRPDGDTVSGRQSVLGTKTRARRGAVPRQAPLRRREPELRQLPRARQRLCGRQGAGARRARPSAQAPHADLVESGLVGAGVLGRPRPQPRGAGRGADRVAGRDGAAARVRRHAARRRSRHGTRLRGGLPRESRSGCRQSRQGARDLRADLRVAADPLRSLGRRRGAGARRQRDRGLSPVHRQGRLRQMPQRLRLHRLRLPRHRPAGRGSRPRRRAAA